MKTHLTTPQRSAPFDVEPAFNEPAKLWLFGNDSLLKANLALVENALGRPDHTPDELDRIGRASETLVLDSRVLVTGIHNPAHQRASSFPSVGAPPRVLVFSGGFYVHLGSDLKNGPFRAARLWRYQFDPQTDLVISRRAPNPLPTFSRCNPTVDRMIQKIV